MEEERQEAIKIIGVIMRQRTSIPICCWAREDIPTEKARENGYHSLTNAELLSIIIGSGTLSENAIDLSRRLLVANDNSLKKLNAMRLKDMTAINGIGDIKASKVLAALELANRMNMESADMTPDLGNAVRVYNYMHPRIGLNDIEEFWALYINQNLKLIQAKRISVGGITEVSVDVRIIMREAVLCNATVLVVCHNHPSGSLSPSTLDDKITLDIKRACELMRIRFQDHVIVVDGTYYSYKENGKI